MPMHNMFHIHIMWFLHTMNNDIDNLIVVREALNTFEHLDNWIHDIQMPSTVRCVHVEQLKT